MPTLDAAAPRPEVRYLDIDPDDDWPTELWPAIERWQEIRLAFRQIQPITAYGQRPVLEGFAGFVGPDRPTVEVKAAHCVRFQAMLVGSHSQRGREYEPSTVNRMTSCVRAFFRDEHELAHIPRNPWLRVPMLPVEQNSPRALSDAEVARLLAAADESGPYAFRNRTFVILSLWTGLRESEVVRLKIEQYDPDAQLLREVRRSKTRKLQDIFVLNEAERQLQDWIRLGRGGASSGPLFLSNKRNTQGGHLQAGSASSMLTKLFRAAGVNGSGHALRHTFLTNLGNTGAPIHVVQKAAGHASMASTQQYVQATDIDVYLAVSNLTSAEEQ